MKIDLLDRLLASCPGLGALKVGEKGWLREVRTGLKLQQLDVAKRLKVSGHTISSYEHNEEAKTISLGSLERMAGAMGCEVVYFLVPKERKTFCDLLELEAPPVETTKADGG